MDDATLTLENPDPLQLALLDAKVLEQPAPLAEQDRDQVDLELVEEPRGERTLRDPRPVHQHVLVTQRAWHPAPPRRARARSARPATAWAARWPGVHYVRDLEAAVRDAKHAAGDKNVLIHGAGIAQRALTAGLLDELEIHLIPVLLGDGRRLFEHLGIERRELERIRVLEGEGGVTHLRYRVTSCGDPRAVRGWCRAGRRPCGRA